MPYPLYFLTVSLIFVAAGALFWVSARARPFTALLALDLLTALLWVYPAPGSFSSRIAIGLLSLPALVLTLRALARCRRRS